MSGGASSRRKGHDFERWVAAQLRACGLTTRRGIQARGGGAEAADVVVEEWPHTHIECKRGKRISLPAATRQAEADAGPDKDILLVYKLDRQEPRVLRRMDGLWNNLSWSLFLAWVNAHP